MEKSFDETTFNRPVTRREFLSRSGAAALGTGIAFSAGAGALLKSRRARAQASIRFWTWLDPNDTNPRAQVQTQLVNRFMETTGIQVKTVLVDWRTLSQQLMRAVAAGEGPDVTRVYSAWLPEHVAAGNLAPLDPVMSAWSQDEIEDIGPPLPAYGGKTMAMYIENRMYLMYYRADYLEEIGKDVPKSLAAAAEAAAAMRNPRRSGLIWPGSTQSIDTYAYASPMIWSLGGNIVNEDKSAAFNQGGALEFYSWLKDLVLKHKSMPKSLITSDEEVLQQAVNSGTCGMAFMGTNRVKSTRAKLAVDDPLVLQTTHAPSPDGSPPPVPVAGWCLGITPNSKMQDEAFALIDALTDTEAQITNAKVAGEMPVRKSALADPWFESDDASEMRGWIEYISAHGRDDTSQKLVKAREMNRLINVATQEMILKNRSVREALDDAASQWNAIKA